MLDKALDLDGLGYYHSKNKEIFDKKIDKIDGKGLSTNDLTDTLKTNYDTAYTHSQSDHAPSDAEVNQNAFSNVKVENITISADSKTDTLELVAGDNVEIVADATSDKITISSPNVATTTALNNEITRAETKENELEEAIESLQNSEDITQTTDTTLSNSYAGGLKMRLKGNTQQISTTGKQLASLNTSGVNVNVGYIKAGKSYTFCFVQTITEGVQHGFNLKYNIDGVMSGIADVNFINLYQNAIATFTSEYDAILYFNPWGSNNQREFMLVEGTYSEFIPFEPYTGGIPSPSPLYPQSINSAVVSGVKVSGKNLFEPTMKTTTLNGITCTNNGDGTYTLNGTSSLITNFVFTVNLYANSDLKFILFGSSVDGLAYADCYIENQGFGYKTNDENGVIITQGLTVASFTLLIHKGVTINNLVVKPMFTEDLTATYADFQPYQENTITLSEPIELNKIGGVADEVAEGKVTRRFVQEVITQALNMDSTNLLASLKLSHSPKPIRQGTIIGNFLCDKLTPNTLEMLRFSNSGIAGYGVNIYIRVSSIEQTVEAYNAWLAENPITVLYELAEPVVTDLPTEDVIALNSLKTYDTVTYVSIDSEVQPTLGMEYGTSRVGGYALEALNTAKNSSFVTSTSGSSDIQLSEDTTYEPLE